MKNVFKSIVFCLILIALLNIISLGLFPKENIKKFGLFKTSSYEILNEKIDTIDVIFMGDSLIYTGISPLEIWHEYGITSYAYATPAQLIDDTYDNMQVVIESQHPKVIMLEANVMFRDPKNAPAYSKYNYNKLINELMPIANHHNNWKKVLFPFVEKQTNYSALNDFKGFRYEKAIKAAKKKDYMKPTDKKVEPIENNINTLKKIQKLCEENDIKLVLISTPNRKSWNYSKYLGIKKLSDELGIEYIDLNVGNPLNINWQTETKDEGSHLNYDGAKKVTAYLGLYLKNTNLLTDHRSDKSYNDWNLAYNRYEKVLNTN